MLIQHTKMNKSIVTYILVLIFLFVNDVNCIKLPSSFKRCRVSKDLDNKPNSCLATAVEDAIHQLTSGPNSDLGLTAMDPVFIKRFHIERGDNSPVAVKLKFHDNDLVGFSSSKIKSVSGKLSSPTNFMMTIKMFADSLYMAGPYSVSGKILILPIQGIGWSNITFADVDLVVTIKSEKEVVKKNKEYLKLTDLKLKVNPKRVYIYLGNLFNGDKALGDNMNKFLNENWMDVYPELQDAMENAYASILFEYCKRIMERIPFKRIFITD